MTAGVILFAAVCVLFPGTVLAGGEETGGNGSSFYALEFSYYNGEDTVSYATRDVARISVSKITEELGIPGTVTDVTAYDQLGYYSADQEDGEWFIRTAGVPAVGSGPAYTGDLFGGIKSLYHPNSYGVGIMTDAGAFDVVMRFIAVPVQLNDPGILDGVTVGDTIYTFASGMPLSTAYIDNDHFQTVSSNEKLTDEPGFVLRVPSEFWPAEYQDSEWAIYDPKIPGATQLVAGREYVFSGDLFSFTYDNAAILHDGTTANVLITYSDARITVDDRATAENGGFPYSISLAYGKTMFTKTSDTRTGNTTVSGISYFKAYSAAVTMGVTIRIVDDDGDPVPGSFIACVEGINIDRHGTRATRAFYNGKEYNFWSEAIQVDGGTLSDIYVRPNNDEAEPYTGNPNDEAALYQRKRYYSFAVRNDEGIKFTGVQWAAPNGTVDPETGEENLVVSAGRNYYYSAGFVTTADAGNGIRMRNYSAGTLNFGYETTYMNGYSIWHRIRSSSTRGGTIQTTTAGNAGGSLSDGGTVLEPGTYVVPDGKTVIYTMTPDEGFELEKVVVKSNSLSYTDGEDVTGQVTPVYDESGAVSHYTYTFSANTEDPQANHENQAIHVRWRKSRFHDLTIRKTTSGGDGTFSFRVRVHGEQAVQDSWKEVASWKTVWKEEYSFAYVTSVGYPLILDGTTYNDDFEIMTFTDASDRLLLYGSCDEDHTPEAVDLTDENGETMTLYKAVDTEGIPYTVTIDGITFDLYSDSRDWSVSGTEGSNEARFWIHDAQDKVHNFFNSFVISEVSTPESVDLSEYGGRLAAGTADVYEFDVTTSGGEGSVHLTRLHYGYQYTVEEQVPDGWKLTEQLYTDGELTTDKTASFSNVRIGTGALIVKKTVESDEPIEDKAFSFTIVFDAEGTYDYTGSSSGTIQSGDVIRLKHDESITVSGLPAGTSYSVTESDNDGYQVTCTGDQGLIPEDDTAVAAFINSKIDSPPTADGTNLRLPLAVMGASAACLALMFLIGRKRKRS